MYIRNHGSDVASTIRLAVLRVLDTVEVVDYRFVEVQSIALVEGVNLAS